MKTSSFRVPVSESIGEVSAEIVQPEKMKALVVLAHGAGAGMNHAFMTKLSAALEEKGVGTLRYNFPYMENGKKRPDVPAVATKATERVLEAAHKLFPDTIILAGGKSFGGRMTSQLLSKTQLEFVKGIVFVGFPLHPAGAPSVTRADHLASIRIPMLFLQGTRDALAELELIKKVTTELSTATLVLFEKADHSFKAGKKEFVNELADEVSRVCFKIVTD